MNLPQSVKDSFWGFSTSAIAVAATYPADTLSKRLQVSTSTKGLSWRGLYVCHTTVPFANLLAGTKA